MRFILASRRVRLAFLLPAVAGACLIGVIGCGSADRQRAPAVDPDQARTVLRTALDHWKQGQPSSSLADASPAIVAQDLDWEAGYQLIDYHLVNDGRDDNANLRVPVQLELRDPTGKELSKEVSYVVGTSPKATVFREMNP